jgi:hypothetical protein
MVMIHRPQTYNVLPKARAMCVGQIHGQWIPFAICMKGQNKLWSSCTNTIAMTDPMYLDMEMFCATAPRVRRQYRLVGLLTLVDCRAAPVDWAAPRCPALRLSCLLCYKDGVDGIIVPGFVRTSLDPCFINIIDTHRGWTSLPSNQRMPPEEPVYACAMPCMAISNYAAVDWDASDIIMLRVEHRSQFEQLWFDTFLMRYRGPFVLPRPFTEEELELLVMVHKSIEDEQLAEFLKPRKTGVSADWS